MTPTDRRTFLAAGAATATLALTGAAGAEARPRLDGGELAACAGRRVRLSGWLRPVDTPGGHVFVLGAAADARDPAAAHADAWPHDLVRVYPADSRAMRAGRVEIVGRLQVGRFHDIATGTAARAVLLDARLA